MRCAPWAVGLNPVAIGLGIRPWDQASICSLGGSARQFGERRAGPAGVHGPVSFCVHVSVSVCVHLDPGHTPLHRQICGRTGLTASFPARVLTLRPSR